MAPLAGVHADFHYTPFRFLMLQFFFFAMPRVYAQVDTRVLSCLYRRWRDYFMLLRCLPLPLCCSDDAFDVYASARRDFRRYSFFILRYDAMLILMIFHAASALFSSDFLSSSC